MSKRASEPRKNGTPTPTRGVPVELDRTRHLRYSLRTFREMRADLGDEVLDQKVIGAEHIAKVLWYGLRHEDPELTIEQLDDLIDLQNLGPLTEALLEATGQGKPDAAAAAASPPQVPAPSPARKT